MEKFLTLLKEPLFTIGLLVFLAPVIIWLYLLFHKANKRKKTIALVFILGTLTAPALLELQSLWNWLDTTLFTKFGWETNFNLNQFIYNNIENYKYAMLTSYVLFGFLEEIVKGYVIIAIDKRTPLINTIGDSIRFSFVPGLAFAFTENIYYLISRWDMVDRQGLIQMIIFRPIFTTMAHMVFSAVFGYFYGISKFSINITDQDKFTGKQHIFSKFIGKLFKMPLSHAYQQQIAIRGLLTAASMHIVFNSLLFFNTNQNKLLIVVVLYIIISFLYLRYLLSRKAGHLVLETDISETHKATMAKKDIEVVEELVGMWFQEKRYEDVIHVCENLLERDPDNKVVQLFRAKAMDKMDTKDTYNQILGSIFKSSSNNSKNVITRNLEEKKMFQKVKKMIKEQLQKEGKEFKEFEKPQPEKTRKLTNNYTEGDTFKI